MKSTKTNVTLEDLLRLKRAEQPAPEFWTQFDRELRAKQLAAIVEPRPWWAPLIRVGARVSHFQLPVGAAAILVVSFITVREYRAPELGSMYVPDAVVKTIAPSSPAQVSALPLSSPNLSSDDAFDASESVARSSEMIDSSSVPVSSAAVSRPMPTTNVVAIESEPSPSARYIAANLAAAQEADPGLLDDVFGPSMRNTPNRQPIRDPLAQVNAPGESRRSRLLASALPVNAGSSDVLVGTSDRVARHLTEERLYDSITRVGLKGDRVAIKF